uniref:Selenocysteine-specific elongation factor n=1 Tax=Cacopsylla melanoneura TaxID=428564 RepID=A0A8D8YMJ7_9HEMI
MDMSEMLNISVGLLGHVDCGKTSLAKALSTTSSTACFDKNPQSQERGITIDLGFSSFSVSPVPENLTPFKVVQFTLVDCPGHASLIRTIIGGSQIINIALLVIDITKGIETQTAECLVVAEITCTKMIIVLNKIDLLANENREAVIAKMSKRLKITLAGTKFNDASIVSVSASPDNISAALGIADLKQELVQSVELPSSTDNKGPMLMAVDHCFSIKGQGTIFTGSILEGSVSINDVVEIPALQISRKVKSIQIFRKSVERAIRGDRVGLCVTQVDSKLFERGLVTSENYLKNTYACIVDMNCIKYYKHSIKSKGKYHCSIGHSTVLVKVTIFQLEQNTNTKSKQNIPMSSLEINSDNLTVTPDETKTRESSENISRERNVNGSSEIGSGDTISHQFDIDENYLFVDEISRDDNQEAYFGLLEFEKPVLAPPNSLVIGSKLDTNIHSASCRLAFHGHMQHSFVDKNYDLSTLKIYKHKIKTGQLDRIVNPYEIICKNLFGKNQLNYVEDMFINFKVKLSTGETGFIENTFGKSGKIKIRLNSEIKTAQDGKSVSVELKFRRYLFNKKKINQE